MFKVHNILCALGNTENIQKDNIAEQLINKLPTLVNKMGNVESEYIECLSSYIAIKDISKLFGNKLFPVETQELTEKVNSFLEEINNLENLLKELNIENVENEFYFQLNNSNYIQKKLELTVYLCIYQSKFEELKSNILRDL